MKGIPVQSGWGSNGNNKSLYVFSEISTNATSLSCKNSTLISKSEPMNETHWNKYGISATNGKWITDILSQFAEVQESILFGSRAKGNFKPGSDIDLAVKGPVSKDTLSALLTAFEESLLPYFVDVVIYEHITNEALREHIDRVGISIYKS